MNKNKEADPNKTRLALEVIRTPSEGICSTEWEKMIGDAIAVLRKALEKDE